MTGLYLFRSVNLLRTGIIIWIWGCLGHSASAQLRMSEVIDQLVRPGQDSILYLDTENLINDLGYNSGPFIKTLQRRYPDLKTENGILLIPRALWLSFRKGDVSLQKFHFSRGVYIRAGKGGGFIQPGENIGYDANMQPSDDEEISTDESGVEAHYLFVDSCIFSRTLSIISSRKSRLALDLRSCDIKGYFSFKANSSYQNSFNCWWSSFDFNGFPLDTLCDLYQIDRTGRSRNRIIYMDNPISPDQEEPWITAFRLSGRFRNIDIGNNRFTGKHNTGLRADFDLNAYSLNIYRNASEFMLDLNEVRTKSLIVRENHFRGPIIITGMVFPQDVSEMELDWSQFSGNILSSNFFVGNRVMLYRPGIYTYDSMNVEKAANDLTKSYQKLLAYFRAAGDLQSYNGCFSEMKDFHGNLSYRRFRLNPDFHNFFNWLLNRLLKIYSNHGTDPALSMTGSFFVILIFSVLYFLFPSEWDQARKREIWKAFREKYRIKGRFPVKKFIKTIALFSKSYLNAVMLSLNAFTTLGFGNIPTVGVARYLCIIEGFLGWFLLSIFTVAIFNQVSF